MLLYSRDKQNRITDVMMLEGLTLFEIHSVNYKDENWGLSILPLKFWNHIFLINRKCFKSHHHRLGIGLGFFSFFVDYYKY